VRLLAVDPGVRKGHWCALFEGQVLTDIRCAVGPKHILPADVYVVETPRLYPGHKRPNDIVDLAREAGMIMGIGLERGAEVIARLPQDWKGQLKKPIHHMRVIKALTEAELRLWPLYDTRAYVERDAKALAITGRMPSYRWYGNDAWDAVALGLTELGRL
jgi:hypothetical protein